MEPTIYIAKIAAVLYLSVGLGILIDKNNLKRIIKDYIESPGCAYIASESLKASWALFFHTTF
jgi:hypothetical protein